MQMTRTETHLQNKRMHIIPCTHRKTNATCAHARRNVFNETHTHTYAHTHFLYLVSLFYRKRV